MSRLKDYACQVNKNARIVRVRDAFTRVAQLTPVSATCTKLFSCLNTKLFWSMAYYSTGQVIVRTRVETGGEHFNAALNKMNALKQGRPTFFSGGPNLLFQNFGEQKVHYFFCQKVGEDQKKKKKKVFAQI